MNIADMYPSENQSKVRVGSARWGKELFERAYVVDEWGPFNKVIQRLQNGFSTLVYLPGNCMRAAAQVVMKIDTFTNAQELLRDLPPGQGIDSVWLSVPSILTMVEQWLRAEHHTQPGFIFYNLDFLAESRRGVYPHPNAQTAALALVEAARSGVVFGMSDRDEPELPPTIARAFTDRLRIDEIPEKSFHRIMPQDLGKKLQGWQALHEGTIRLIASRLRWTDPLRAHRVMLDAMDGADGVDDLMDRIIDANCTVDYVQPSALQEAHAKGFLSSHVDLLRNCVIRPYRQWKSFRGEPDEVNRMLKKLPPGAILYGPPGTGKTHLARWIAHEIGLPVRIVSGGDLRAGEWGQAERNVQALFRDARRAAPCVLILDDADDLLPSRKEADGTTASAERAVVNEFLQQLQGMRGQLEGVLVILTTNRFGSLDPAAKARLPVQLRVPYPADEQLPAIVKNIASEYGYDLPDDVEAKLVALFREPLIDGNSNWYLDDNNRFSPREIREAMRMLESWSGSATGGRYQPTAADVQRVRDYYKPRREAPPERSVHLAT